MTASMIEIGWNCEEGQQGSIKGSVSFSSFVNSFNGEIAFTLNELAEDTKLGGAAGILEYRAASQSDLNKLEKWTNRKVLKITKYKCKVLYEEKKNPRLGTDWLESSFSEEELGSTTN
ncbi:rna-directed dna polymerase from mobile element jockey- hypothetical protein [Limosa lapponica baueri]|uniref:Rna-directed dna polymerase from mobile element jockey-like n=1 Tax=Limosa lapponica baueri TaxID=1758121 RepID=A0A2I0TN89_LIMLA|nr:rna-directed dna polymerase from mobile element jockey- hypothetical protein [Limosa lapponica baueri]